MRMMGRIRALGMIAVALMVHTASASEVDSAGACREWQEQQALLQRFRQGLSGALDHLKASSALARLTKPGHDGLLGADERRELKQDWAAYLDYHMGLQAVQAENRDFLAGGRDALCKFQVYRGAFNAQYRQALSLLRTLDSVPELDTVLNEASPALGLAQDSLAAFRFRFLNVAKASEFSALEAWKTLKAGTESAPMADEDAAEIWHQGHGKGELMTLVNAGRVLRDGIKQGLFPAQAGISTWMGDAKVYRQGEALVSHEQIAALGQQAKPGDIFLERHEWYLSNIGLPGFWTHAALYIGTADERRQWFATPEVRAWVRRQGIATGDFEALLSARHPEAYHRSEGEALHGGVIRVMEAISEGVSFTTLAYTGHSDSIVLLRPALSRVAVAEALLRAFGYQGRPYDFDFDFQTDQALVCTELVYKSYEGLLPMAVPVVMGRHVLSANELARQIVQGPLKDRLKLVAFFDGDEYGKQAVAADAEAFASSWRRPNWYILFNRPLAARKPVGVDGKG